MTQGAKRPRARTQRTVTARNPSPISSPHGRSGLGVKHRLDPLGLLLLDQLPLGRVEATVVVVVVPGDAAAGERALAFLLKSFVIPRLSKNVGAFLSPIQHLMGRPTLPIGLT